MEGLRTGAPIVQVYHEKSRILPDVSRVLTCLYEKRIKFETHIASYKSLLKLQASTHAPVPFYDGPIFLEDSREICHHIAEKYERVGYPFLLGKDALERASVEQWLHNEAHAFNPPSRALFCHLAFPPDKYDNDDDIDMHTRKLEEVLEVYEQRLSDSEFLAGNMFTLADLVHLPNSHYITSSDKFVYLYDSRKNVRRWWDTISSRDSWQQVLIDMERVEEQNKQEELKEQQQKSRPKTPGYPLRIYSRKQTTTEPRTVLMHPAGSVSSSAIAPQTEKPLTIDDISDVPLVSSSQSTPTDPKTSVAKSKETPFQEKPPHKSPIHFQSTIAPVTSPITSEKPQTVGDDSFSTKTASTSEPTKTDLPTRHKPRSSKVVSNNLHVFDYYKASNHSEEATTFIEPTRQKGSETLDQFSESSITTGHTKTSSIPAEEEPDQCSKFDFYKSDNTSTGVDSQDKDLIPYNEHTPQSARPTDSTASKLHEADVYHKRQVEQWHAATTVPSDLKEDVDHLRTIQQVKSSNGNQRQPSQDSEQATSRPVPQESMSMELVEGQAKITQGPYTYQGRDVSSPLSQQNGGVRGIAMDDKTSSDQSSALLPTTQKHAATPPSRKAAAKETHGTSSPQAGFGGGQYTNKQLRVSDPGSIARQTAAQATFGESKAADSMISSGGSSDAFQSPLPTQDLDLAHHTTAPFENRDPLTQDTTEQTKDIISTPWQMAAQGTENTADETKIPDSSSPLVQPLYFQRAKTPSEKQGTPGLIREKEAIEDHHGAIAPIQKRHANIKDTAGQYMNIAFKPKQMISEDDRDTFKDANSGDTSLLREQPQDTRQAATTTDKETNQDDRSAPSERTQTIYPSVTASRTRYSFTKDASKQPRGVLSTPRHITTQDDNDTFEESMIADEVASTEQHLNAQRALNPPKRQEVEDSPKEITSFQKRPYVEDKQAGDTASQQIAPTGVQDTFEETKIADSSVESEKPMYTQKSALPPPRQAKFQHAQEKGRQSEARSHEPQKMMSRDARDTLGERKTGTLRELSSERLQAISQPRTTAAEDARGATGETIQLPNILDTSKKSRGAFEETQDASPTLPRAHPFGAQDAPESKTPTADHQRMDVSTQLQSDAHDWFLQSKLPAAVQKGLGSLPSQERDARDLHATPSEGKPVSSERLREMIKKTQPTAPKEHPIDTQGSIEVEKTPFVYQKKPVFAQDSQNQAQIIPRGGKGDGSTWEHEASDGPYNDEKLSATATEIAKSRNDFDAEQSHKEDTTDDQKVVSPLQSKESTSQVQPPGTSQDAAFHGHLSSKLSTIEDWQRASAPFKDTTTRSSEQRVETPILPIEPETSGVQSTSPSVLEAATTDHAVIDDKSAKQSNIHERLGEPKQIQAPVTDAHPASPTKRKTPDGPETGHLELIRSSEGQILDAAKVIPPGPATILEDSHDAVVDKKTTTYDARGDQLVTGPLHEQAWPPAPTHEATEPMGGRQTSKEPQLHGSSQSEVAHAEHKSTLSDKKPGSAAQPPSPAEPVNIDSNEYAADDTIVPEMIFRQETRPSVPIIRRVPASDSQSVTKEIQEVNPDHYHSEDSGKALVPSQDDQNSHTSQAISHQEDMKYSPSTSDSQELDIQPPSSQVHEVNCDESSGKQGSQVGSAFGPNELGATEPAKAKALNDFNAEESRKKDTADDHKVISRIRSKEPTSQVQPLSEPLQDAAPHGDLSSKLSTIVQWQQASAPLNDVTTSSGDDEMSIPTINQKPTPMSQQGSRSAHGANEMTKEYGVQREEPPILPIDPEIYGVQGTQPSFPEAPTAHHANIDEIVEEPIQMQAPLPDGHPASASTKRASHDGHEIAGDLKLASTPDGQILESAKARHDPATVHEDIHDNLLSHDMAKDTFKGMKYADSTPSSAKPIYTSLTPSVQAEVEEARDEGRQSSKAIPEQQKMSKRETDISEGPLSDHRPSGQEAVEDVRGVTGDTIQSPHILDTTRKSRGTFEETKTPGSTLPKVQPFSSQDVQPTNGESVTPTSGQRKDVSTKPQRSVQDVFQPSKLSGTNQRDSGSLSLKGKDANDAETIVVEEKIFSTERLREMLKESESTMPKVQESQEQAQIIPAGEEADSSTLKHQQASDAPHTLDEKFSASAPARADIHDDPRAEVSYRKDTTANQKVETPLLNQKPTSQVHRPSEPYQDADPHGDLSGKLSNNGQWQHASALLKGASTDSDDNEINMLSNIEQKPMPVKEGHLSSQHANQMAQQSGEQTVEPPEHATPSLPEAATSDHAVIDDKVVKQSILDERRGEPKHMQAPITDAHPASSSTKRKIPDGRENGELKLGGSSEGKILDAEKETSPDPATISEDSHDATIDEKTTTYDASGDHLVTGSLHEQARPPAPTHEVTEAIGGQTSNEPQLGGSSQTEVARAEHKSTLSGSDQKPARAAQPLSPDEPVNKDSNDSIAPQMIFRQQTRPSTPITSGVPALDSQSVTRKIQEVTPDNRRTDDSRKPLLPSQEDQILHASQAIPRQEDMTYSPSVRDSPKSDTQLPSAQIHGVTPDKSSEKQGSHAGSTSRPDESDPAKKKFAPSGLGHSAEEPSSAEPREEHNVVSTAEQIKALPTVIGQQGTPETRKVSTSEDVLDTIPTYGDVHSTTSTKPPRISLSVQEAEPTSLAQTPPFHVAHDTLHTGTTLDDALGNAQSMKPSASPYAQHGQDSVHSKQSPPSTVERNGVIGDSAPETQQISSTDEVKGIPTTLDQQEILSTSLRLVSPSSDTQRPSDKAREDAPDDLREAASKPASHIGEVRPPRVVPASAPAAQHGAATDEEALDIKKFVQSGQDSVHSTQPPSSPEQRNGGIRDSASSTQRISSTKQRKGDAVASAPDQVKDSQITLHEQDILPPVKSVLPSSDIQHRSGKVHEDVPPDAFGEAKHIVQTPAQDKQDETAPDEAAPNENKFVPPEPTSSTEPRNEEIRNSATPTPQISSAETKKENVTISAPSQDKDLQTTLDQQDVLSAPVKLVSPSSYTHPPSRKNQDDASANLGEAASKPSAFLSEARASTVVPESAPVTQHGATRDEAGQNSVHSKSTLLRNKEIGDSAPSTQQISSTRPRKGDVAASAPDQAKDTQMTLGRQDLLPPVRLASPSSNTQHPSGKVHEDVPADDLREAKNIVQASAPDTQDEKKIAPSEPTSSTEPRNKEIRDSSTNPRKDVIIAAPNRGKDLLTTLDQQDIQSMPVRAVSPSSDTQHPSEKAREDSPADDLGEDTSKSLRQVRLHTVVPASAPARLHGAEPNDSETARDEQRILPSGSEVLFGQDSVQSVQPSFSSEQTKEDNVVTTADQTEDLQTTIHQQNITPTDTAKTPLPGTKDVSRKSQQNTSDDIDTDESIPGEERVSLGQREGHATKPYRTAVGEKTTTSPSSKAYSSESGSGLTQGRTDVRPSTGEGPTEASFPEREVQTHPPLATQDTPLDASSKAKSAVPEAKARIASASETQPGSTQPQVEAAPIGQNLAISDQESAHASKSPSTAGPRKGETYVFGPADQISVPKTILANWDTRQIPDGREDLSKFQESSRDDDGISNLSNPLFRQGQASYAEHASEVPTSEEHSAIFYGKTTLPSSQSQRQPSTDEVMEPVTSSAAYSDAPKSEPGGDKTTTAQGDQVNTLLNDDLSTSQPVRPSESADFKGTNSEQKLEGASTYEKSKAHQTDQSDITSSKDSSKEANEAIRSYSSTTYREQQKQSSWPKETMKSSGELERKEQADQAIVQSPDGNVKQIEQTKTHDIKTGEPEERYPQENNNPTNNKVSQVEALDISGKQTSGVQLRGANSKNASDSTEDAPHDIQTRSNSKDSLRSYEESKVLQQSEGKTQGGETEAPLSDTVQKNRRGLPENSYQNNSSRQSQAEASHKSAGTFSPSTQKENKSSSELDGPTDGTKSGDAEDKSG